MRYFIVFWLICSVLAYGITLGYFLGKFKNNSMEDKGIYVLIAILYALLGPVGVFLSYFMSGFAEHGLKFTCD